MKDKGRYKYYDLGECEVIQGPGNKLFYFNDLDTVSELCDVLNFLDDRVSKLEYELDELEFKYSGLFEAHHKLMKKCKELEEGGG